MSTNALNTIKGIMDATLDIFLYEVVSCETSGADKQKDCAFND